MPTITDYANLDPNLVLNAIESKGLDTTASLLSLNSYENRVFQIGLEEGNEFGSFIIAKFYRPGRWTDEQIKEEHQFAFELADREIPVVAPVLVGGESLFEFEGYRFALFPRKGGYAPEPGQLDQLHRLGSLLGRIHQCGRNRKFEKRDSISVERNLLEPKEFLLNQGFIPEGLQENYLAIFSQLEEKINRVCNDFSNIEFIRCHGDWHLGNILWREDSGGHIVDLDDCINGPAVQDLWMMLSGEAHEQAIQLQSVLRGYEQFSDFNRGQLGLIESLRTMRIVFYAAWLAKRWDDPAFPMNFPWFNTQAFWQQHIRELQDQIPLIETNLIELFE